MTDPTDPTDPTDLTDPTTGTPDVTAPGDAVAVPAAPQRTRFAEPPTAPLTAAPPAPPAPADPPPAPPAVEPPVAEERTAPEARAPVAQPAVVEPAVVEPAVVEPLAPVLSLVKQPDAGAEAEVAAPAPAPQPEPDADDVPGSGGPSRTVLLALRGLVGVLVLATAALGAWAISTSGEGGAADDRTSALKASKAAAKLIFSYDYRHLDKDFAAGTKVTTGAFTNEYNKTTVQVVKETATKYQAVVVADVSDGGVERTAGKDVVVLLFVNQQSNSTLTTQPKYTQSRVRMTMHKVGGTWRVAKITAL